MAYDQIHIVDATSQMIEVSLRSSTTGMLLTGKAYGDMTIKYQREGAAAATTVSVVTATKGSYTSGGFVETDIAGLYQFGIPAGALATGAKAVTLTFACTGALDVVKRIVLIGADLRNANSLGLAYLTGDAYARLGAPAGASVSADIADLPTVTEFNARTLAAADYVVVSDLPVAPDNASITAILEDTGTTLDALIKDVPTNAELATALGTADDATLAAIAALNNLSSAQAQSAAAAALTAYDPPTNAELEARTLLAASYFDPAADVVAHVTLVDTTTTNTDMVAEAPTAAANADAVWDEALAAHSGAGSAGLALATASSGGVDPSALADAIWDEALSGHSTAGTTGKKLTDLTNTDLSGVATATNLALVKADTAAILADTGTDGVKIHPTQGAVTFGQVKITTSSVGEGALHIVNSGLAGTGMFVQGQIVGLHNRSTAASGIGQFNEAGGADGYGQANQALVGTSSGQYNVGGTADIYGDITGSVSSVVSGVSLADDAITASKFDNITAFPLESADTGTTQIARTGADSDTLETLSDQIDGVVAGSGLTAQETANAVHNLAPIGVAAVGSIGANLDSILNGLTGVGLIPLVYTVTEPGGVVPISGVTVELYTEEACLNCVRRGVTNSFGVVTFWMSTVGTYWIKCAKDRYSFELDSETVAV